MRLCTILTITIVLACTTSATARNWDGMWYNLSGGTFRPGPPCITRASNWDRRWVGLSGGTFRPNYYGYSSRGGYDRDLNRFMGVGSLGVEIYQVVSNSQIENRAMTMAEQEQAFQHQQAQPQQQVVYVPQPVQQVAYTSQPRVVYGVQLPPAKPQQQVATQPTASSPVIVPANLTRTAEEIAERIKQQEADKANSAESAKIKAEIERLKLELEKSKLELEKSKLQKELEKTKAN